MPCHTPLQDAHSMMCWWCCRFNQDVYIVLVQGRAYVTQQGTRTASVRQDMQAHAVSSSTPVSPPFLALMVAHASRPPGAAMNVAV